MPQLPRAQGDLQGQSFIGAGRPERGIRLDFVLRSGRLLAWARLCEQSLWLIDKSQALLRQREDTDVRSGATVLAEPFHLDSGGVSVFDQGGDGEAKQPLSSQVLARLIST
jgi:hypothetical protein